MTKILHKELSYKINGLCFQVHKELGRFCREKQYAERLSELLGKNDINYKKEFEIKKANINSPKGNRADLLIKNQIILDVKAKNYITKEDYYQMQRYLRGANLELGLIVNSRDSHLKPKRVLNSDANMRIHSNNKENRFGSFGFISGHSDRPNGFTLIETIIYIGIIGLVISSFVFFSLTISNSRAKTYVTQETQANGRDAIEAITRKIRSASGINSGDSVFSSDPGSLSLVMPEAAKNPTLINLSQDNGVLRIKEGGADFIPVVSDEVKITNLVFTDLTPPGGPGNIKIEMTVEYNGSGQDVNYSASQSLETTVSLRR